MADALHVLVVDNHLMFAEAIKLLLANEDGIEIEGTVGTGEEAVELAGQTCPEVVLMDIDLPGIDGIEATRQIRAISPQTQVVVVSAFQQASVMARAVEAGAAGFVPKTRAIDDLIDVIAKILAIQPLPLTPMFRYVVFFDKVREILVPPFIDIFVKEPSPELRVYVLVKDHVTC